MLGSWYWFVAVAEALLEFQISSPTSNSVYKRDTTASLQQSNYYYWIEVAVGSPSQLVSGFLDTGSSDFWVATPNVCNTAPDGNLLFGTLEISCNYTYDPKNSESLKRNDTGYDFSVAYVSGKYAKGFYAQDTISVGEQTLLGMNLAIADNATGSPALGISYAYSESCVKWTKPPLQLDPSSCTPYDNFPMQLKQQGIISTVSYSMWLDTSHGNGSILFGGVDHSKYSDVSLTKIPIEKEIYFFDRHSGQLIEYPEYTRILVALTGIRIQDAQGNTETIMSGALPALLDSGTPTCMVPSVIVAAFYKAFGIFQESTEAQGMPCGVPDNCYISFDFRGYQVSVPVREFIRPLLSSGEEIFDNNGDIVCSPGVESLDNMNYMIIGQNVLSSLYTVYDLENNEVAFAQFAPAVNDSNVENITSSIPSATEAQNYSIPLSLSLSVAISPSLSLSFSQIESIPDESWFVPSLRTTVNGMSIPITANPTTGTVSGGLSGLVDSIATGSDGASNTGSTETSNELSSGNHAKTSGGSTIPSQPPTSSASASSQANAATIFAPITLLSFAMLVISI